MDIKSNGPDKKSNTWAVDLYQMALGDIYNIHQGQYQTRIKNENLMFPSCIDMGFQVA